ncbi:MAG: hypothetical protein JWN75_821 [Candidatus Saccharibacteria bacterium]|nr:hypothetical protein [Candidatus Saccharibacteria bacterium]
MFSFLRNLKNRKINRERILALDLLRGTFLVIIISTHIAWRPSLFTFVGGGGQLFASAAEGFFTISGLLVGYLYGPRVLKETKKVFKKIWKRAALLYFLATFFTLFYTAWAVLQPNSQVYTTLYTRDPVRFLIDTFTLRYAFGWAEFLNRYAMFMIFAPFAVWLVAKGRAWIVAIISFAIWFFLRETDQFLPFSSWQLVFMFGIILGYYLPHIEAWFKDLPRARQRFIFITVCSAAFVSYLFSVWLFVVAPLVLPSDAATIIFHNQLAPYFDKNHLAPARVVIGILWFAALYLLYRRYDKQISRYSMGIFEILGRQSLFVYGLHAFLLFSIDLYLRPSGDSIIANTLVTFQVLVIVYLAAYYRAHFTRLTKRILGDKWTTTL